MEYKIIIAKRFEEKYLSSMKKYFSKNKFIEILKSKRHKFILLKNPFEKIKIKVNGVDFRGVLVYFSLKKIIPLLLY